MPNISSKTKRNITKKNGTLTQGTVSAPYSNEYIEKNPVASRQTTATVFDQNPTLTFQPQKTSAPIPYLTDEQTNVYNVYDKKNTAMQALSSALNRNETTAQPATTKPTDSFYQKQTDTLAGLNDVSRSALEELYKVNTQGIESATGYDKSKAYGALTLHNMKKQIEEDAKNALKEQGYDDFDSVYEYYSMNRDKESTMQAESKAKDDYAKASTLGKIGKNLSTIFWSPVNNLKAIPELGKQTVNEDAPLNIYSGAYRDKNISDAVREATQEEIADKAGDKATMAYNIGMSMGDSAAALPLHAVSGGLSMLSMGANAATSTAKEATQRGIAKDNAVATGITSGAIEAITEKLPMDNLFKIAKGAGKTGLKNAIVNVLKQAGIEATEETISTICNTIADGVINKNNSQYNQSIDNYKNQGATADEAKVQANIDFLKNVGVSALGGAVSGGLMGTGAQIIKSGLNGKYNSLNPLEENTNAKAAEQQIYTSKENSTIPYLEDADSMNMWTKGDAQNKNASKVAKNGSTVSENAFANKIPAWNENINIADNVAGNPTLTEEFRPQQATQNAATAKNNKPEVKNSRYSTESIPNKSDLPDEVKQIFVDNPTTYNVLKNADTKAKAEAVLQSSDNVYKTISEYKRMLENKDAAAVPLGYELSKQLIDSGDVDTAVDIIREMSTSLTKSGQFTQAAAMTLLHENPQAAMRYAIKEIDSINNAGAKKFGDKWTDISLTEDEINAFASINEGDTEAIKGVYESIGNRISKEYPATKWEKFVELTKIGMLLNPRTHIRNTVSNAMLLPIRSLTDRVSAVGMNVAHILNPDVKVTQSLTGSIGGKYKQSAEEVWETVKEGILGTDNKWDDLSGSVFKKQVFKDSKVGTAIKNAAVSLTETLGNTKIVNHLAGDKLSNFAKQLDSSMTGSFIENLRNLDYYLLSEVEDDPFVKKNFVNRLASYMKAQGITDANNVPEEAISLATSEALKATFKDDNMFTNLLSGVKKTTGKFGEVMFPFTKTPANLAMRGIDYSPAGIISTVNKIRNKNDFSTVMDSFSKNLVGTAAIAVGYYLAKNGIIQGALSDDKDEAEFQKQQGKQAYSFNINGTSYTFDWAQPASIPLIIGATIHDSLAEDDADNQNQLNKVLNYTWQGTKAAANSWVELSPLQTFAEMFGGNGYGQNDIAGNIMGAVAEMPLRLLPSLGSAVANTADTSQRVTYNNGDAVGTLVNQAKAKIPFFKEELPQAYDTWGNPKVNANSTAQAAFNNFISPGKNAVDASTAIDDEIQRLYDATGNNVVFPRKAEWSVKVGEESKKLTAEEYSAYQKGMGELSYKLAEAYINSESYKNMEDADRAEILDKLYGFSKALYEEDTFGKPMSDSNANIAEMYEAGGVDMVIEYMDYKNVLSANGLSDTEKSRELWNSGGKEAIVKHAETKAVFDSLDIDYREDSKAANVYNEKGEEGLTIWNDLRQASKNENGEIDTKLLYQNISRSKLSEEEKGYYLLNNISNTDKIKSIVNDLGNAGVYRYYTYKYSADKDGNGSLNVKDELIPYLNSQSMSNGERAYWFDLMKSSEKTQNPYGKAEIPYWH